MTAFELGLDATAFLLEAALQIAYALIERTLIEKLQQFGAVALGRAGLIVVARLPPGVASGRNESLEGRCVHAVNDLIYAIIYFG